VFPRENHFAIPEKAGIEMISPGKSQGPGIDF
jgi:hypothetical protein